MNRKNEAYWVESKAYWMIKVQKDGQRKAFYCSTPGKKGKIEAEKRADRWLEVGDENAGIRLDAAWSEYLEQVQLLKGSSTYEQTESAGRLWILPGLERRMLKSITDNDWQKCINTAYKAGRSKKTLCNIRGRIYNFCKFARKARYLNVLPCDIEVPDDAPTVNRDILQPESLNVLFSKDWELWRGKQRTAYYVNAFRFIVALGLRRGELCGLKNSDITDGILYVNRSYNRFLEITNGKNKNAIRKIVLNDFMLGILDDQKLMLKKQGIISPYLFPAESGDITNPKTFSAAWRRFKKTHDLACDVQGLRRTLLSVIKADMPVELAKRVVGHSRDMDTYGIYGREVDGELERASQIMKDVFDKILDPK